MKRLITALCLLLVTTISFAEAPDELVKRTAEDVLSVVHSDTDIQAGDKAKIYALAEEKILPNFDFEKVSRLVLGKNWTRASDAQKEGFRAEFKDLLLRTYANALSKYKDQEIEYKPLRMEPDASDATVKTLILQDGGPPIAVDYNLSKKDEAWKVHDVVIEGISLVTNYRSQFAQEVRRNGLDSLISKLAAKNQSLAAKD